MRKEKMLAAKVMEKVARKSAEMAADSRCMYIYHQPKMPSGLKNLKKDNGC